MMILDDLVYETGSFEGLVMKDTDYVTWFLQSSGGPTINDCPVNGGRVLGGITRARRTSEAHLRLHVDTLQARVKEFKGATIARDGYVQKETVKSLA